MYRRDVYGQFCRCDFEFAISLRENGVEYKCDIITALKHRLDYRGARAAVAITDGLVKADEGHVTAKTERESFFPDSLLQAALSIQLENGRASYESDRVHILNWLIGRTGSDLELPVLMNDRAYDALNNMLHGRIAAGAVRRAVEGGEEMLATYLKAINLSNLRKLEVDFLGCDACTSAIAVTSLGFLFLHGGSLCRVVLHLIYICAGTGAIHQLTPKHTRRFQANALLHTV